MKTHGLSRKDGAPRREYQSWNNMHQRCENPKNPKYHLYGGRGIKVCGRWSGPGGFANFLADMGDRPAGKKSVDRIKADGNYEPDNCRWATALEQHDNQRSHSVTKLNWDKVRAIRADPRRPYRVIAADYGVSYDTISEIRCGRSWKER